MRRLKRRGSERRGSGRRGSERRGSGWGALAWVGLAVGLPPCVLGLPACAVDPVLVEAAAGALTSSTAKIGSPPPAPPTPPAKAAPSPGAGARGAVIGHNGSNLAGVGQGGTLISPNVGRLEPSADPTLGLGAAIGDALATPTPSPSPRRP